MHHMRYKAYTHQDESPWAGYTRSHSSRNQHLTSTTENDFFTAYGEKCDKVKGLLTPMPYFHVY